MSAQIDLDDVTQTMCNYAGCDNAFEIEPAAPEDGYPEPTIVVPVECPKGKFCSEEHRAQAMYEAQDQAGKLALRRYYLGAKLTIEHRSAAHPIMDGWDLYIDEDAETVSCTLSPEGGTLGKEGVEDDCEALLLPESVRSTLWLALYKGILAAAYTLQQAEKLSTEFLGQDYVNSQIDFYRKEVADAEAALKALEGLRGVL